MLDVRRLRVLCEVARCGSLSSAAAVLGYTQPAVSRQIAVLESEVGLQLLQRLPHGVTLTDAGRLLVDRAEELLVSLNRTEEELRAHASLHGGTLRVATFASGAATVIPVALTRFRDRHPDVELIVSIADPVESLPLLRAGELDLAFSHVGDAPGDGARGRRSAPPGGLPLQTIPLFEDPMVVALPAGHPLAAHPELSLPDLAEELWMLATTDTCPDADLFLDACAAVDIRPRVAFQYDDYAALLGFVAAGVGISVIPEMVSRSPRPGVVVRALHPPLPPRPISAALPAGYRSPAVSAMLEILVELAPEWVAGRSVDRPDPGALAGGPPSAR
jgi:DNA-binding transcriptional LysR family regulator